MIIKKIAMSMLTGASGLSAVLMVLVGYSDRVSPVDHPLLACMGMAFPIFVVINLLFLLFWVFVKWRRMWIPIAGLVLAYAPIRTYLPLHGHGTPPEGSIKVLSYNVCGFSGNGLYSNGLDTIASYLRQQAPDIVCLQEVHTSRYDPKTAFGDLFPYQDTVHVNAPGALYINAVGLHSRFPILRKERIHYTSDSNGSAAFFLLIGIDTVVVVNNHLESTHLSTADRQHFKDVLKGKMGRDSAEAEARHLIRKVSDAMVTRAPQADAVHDYVQQQLSRYAVIVCGDFNDTPISYTRHTIAQGLTDCFVESGMGLGLSYNQKGFNFRIDQMMCSPHFTPHGCTVDSHIDASDHYPIYCWLTRN